MRPAHPSMYGQPTYLLPQPPVQYYTTNVPPGNNPPPLPQYARNPQELQPVQPVYLVPQQPVMQQQYSALIGVPTQVMGNPVPQAMGVIQQGVVPGGYAPQGWAYRPAMVERAWGYGPSGYSNDPQQQPQSQPQQQEQRVASNWQQPGPSQQGFRVSQGNGFQGRADGHGNGGTFQERIGSHGNGVRMERGFEGNNSGGRHYNSGGGQNLNRQARPPQSPAPLQAKQLSCDPCEKTFAVYAQYTAHMNTHVQCDDVGCSFSASGKVVKEHKLTAHSKSSNPSPRKAALKISEEDSDEIKAWREERRRNYPTRLNIQRKKEVLEGKVARGELIDEDARQRRQRMKEILAKQAELGVPVAEVPAYYLSHKDDRARGRKSSDRSPTGKSTVDSPSASTMNAPDSKKRKLGEDATATACTEEQPPKSARTNTDPPTQSEHENPEAKLVPHAETDAAHRDEAANQPGDKPSKTQCYFYQQGRCRKGSRCHFAHTRRKRGEGESRGRQKGGAAAAEKKLPPTLLSKLLRAEITRDKSHILQCLRFFVANNFLLNGVVQPSESTPLALDSDAAEDSSDYSEGEVVEAPDMLSADTAIISSLLSEQPEVLAKVIEMETQA